MPVVLLHGLIGAPSNWDSVLAQLPPACPTLAVDLPFFPERGAHVETLLDACTYAERWMDERDLSELVLCGSSLGGQMALELAHRRPDRVKGLILTGASGLYERRSIGGGITWPALSKSWIRRWVVEPIFADPASVTDEMLDEGIARVRGGRGRELVRRFVAIAKSARRHDVTRLLGRIECPVLLVWGRQDRITPPDVAEQFRDALPASELVFLDGAGHAPMLERPLPFGEAMARWWTRHFAVAPARSG